MFSTGSEVPAFSPTNPYCHYAPGFDTRFTGGGHLHDSEDRRAVQRRADEQPGHSAARRLDACRAPIVRRSLGRPLSNSAPNVTVNLLKPDDMRSDRVNELDFRVGKILRFGRTRANVALDLLNALNLDTILVPEPGVHPRRRVADADRHADAGDDGTDREDHRAIRLLRRCDHATTI